MEIKLKKNLINIELIITIFILLNISIGGDLYWHTSYSNSIKDIAIINRALYFNGIFIPNYLLFGIFNYITSFYGLFPTILGPIILLSYSSNTLNLLRTTNKHQIYIISLPVYILLIYFFSATNLYLITSISLILRRILNIRDNSFLPTIITWCTPIGLLVSPIFFIFDKRNRKRLFYFSIFSIFLLFISQPYIGYDNIFNETIYYFDITDLLKSEEEGGLLQEILFGRFVRISIYLFYILIAYTIFNKYLKSNIRIKQIYFFIIILPFLLFLNPLILSIQSSPNLINSFFVEKPKYVDEVFKCTWLPRIMNEGKCSKAAEYRVSSFNYYKN